MTAARIQTSADGAILFDPAAVAQAGAGEAVRFDATWFEPHRARGDVRVDTGGRGQSWFLDAPFGAAVLRHYRRGGAVARLLGDRYLWTGAERTRCFAEFRLLAQLDALHLPVPVPIAARYVRRGLYYSADLIMGRIAASETLARRLCDGHADLATMGAVGATLAAFHAAGAWHADLNAHNILIAQDRVFVIDFDRGELRTPVVAWQQDNLARLKRSLLKLGAANDGDLVFERRLWQPLLAGYDHAVLQAQRNGVSA